MKKKKKKKKKASRRKPSKPTSRIATLEDIERAADRRERARASWAPLWRALSEAAGAAASCEAAEAAVNAARFGELATAVWGTDSLGAQIREPGQIERQILRQEAARTVQLEDMTKQLRAARVPAAPQSHLSAETLVRENLRKHPDPAPPARQFSRVMRTRWIQQELGHPRPHASTVGRWMKKIKAEPPSLGQTTA